MRAVLPCAVRLRLDKEYPLNGYAHHLYAVAHWGSARDSAIVTR